MNGTELRTFSHYQIFYQYCIPVLEQNSSKSWLILKFVFIHWKTVKVSHNDQIRMSTWFRSVLMMNGIELRSFSHYLTLTKNAYLCLSRNLQKLTNFEVHLHSLKKLWKSVKMIKVECKDDLQVYYWWMEKS